jgi:hypothetical protein
MNAMLTTIVAKRPARSIDEVIAMMTRSTSRFPIPTA